MPPGIPAEAEDEEQTEELPYPTRTYLSAGWGEPGAAQWSQEQYDWRESSGRRDPWTTDDP